MEAKLKMILNKNERYKDFIHLDTPTPFSTWAKGKEYETVQVHDSSVFEFDGQEGILGFVGVFTWKNDTLSPLDGDVYDPDMPVIAYEEFEGGVDVLVEAGKW